MDSREDGKDKNEQIKGKWCLKECVRLYRSFRVIREGKAPSKGKNKEKIILWAVGFN